RRSRAAMVNGNARQRITQVYLTLGRTFGVWITPLFTAVLIVGLRLTVAAGMALDVLVSSRLRRTRVERPIVIVGNPRSGTTFLHRFLVNHGIGAGSELWRMLYPSVVLQTLLRPFLPVLEIISPARHHSTVAHQTSLSSVETDDVAVLFRYLDGFFLYGFFLGWAEEDLLHWFDPKHRDTADRDFGWLESMWRRILVATGRDRVVAKLFSLGARTPEFLERFPDARVLYMVRDPLNVIPSGMSLVTGVLDKKFGFWSLPEDKRARYLERLYGALVELLQRFHADWTSGRIDRDRVMVVRYDRMMVDFEGLMDELLGFVGHEVSPEFLDEIRRTGEKQRAYESRHHYDLAKFGLDENRIRQDCAMVYETFLPPLDSQGEQP
ncbi:MAG: sulfotransferase, partial [Myxococcota bacterium]|nr:sulfotransferase [Myxococcota bacterium]